MKKTILTLVIVVTSLTANAQNTDQLFVPFEPVFMTYNVSDLFLNYSHHVNKILDKTNSIDGSPYVFDDFLPGIVYSKKEKAAFHLDLNINAFTNLFEFVYENDVYQMPNFAFDSVVINNSKFIPVSIVENDKVKIFSMEVLDSDKNGNYLLKRNITKFSDAKSAGPYNDAQRATFNKSSSEYFINTSENNLIPLSNLNKLKESEHMPEDLSSFLKKNKIRKNNEASLKRLFAFVYDR